MCFEGVSNVLNFVCLRLSCFESALFDNDYLMISRVWKCRKDMFGSLLNICTNLSWKLMLERPEGLRTRQI